MENHVAICKHELESVTDMETSLSMLFGVKKKKIKQWYKKGGGIIQFQFGKIFPCFTSFCKEDSNKTTK